MKNLKKVIFAAIFTALSINLYAQKAETVSLTQTTGEFDKKELTLKAGQAYVFDVKNDGVDHDLGFVIAPKGKTEKKNHIPEAYLQKTIKNGESARSKSVTLEKGEYVYFCPLNPTPLYTLIVK